MRVLFVTNGHGEMAIAERIARELREIAPDIGIDHLALVGSLRPATMNEVGPRAEMPSGGLIAMGNLRNIASDVRAGLLKLTWRQAAYLRAARGRYAAVVAVGDVYALLMALLTAAASVYVGTAKSVSVAGYGALEAAVLRHARACFVRDEATAAALRERRVDAQAANAIADLVRSADVEGVPRPLHGYAPALALLPGSRESAYGDARFLLEIARRLAGSSPTLGAALSIAPGLNAERFSRDAQRNGWQVQGRHDQVRPFSLMSDGREVVHAWRGSIGALLVDATLVLGQAGTGNEIAAAAGVPIVAFEEEHRRATSWYRRRQRGLLGEALVVYPRRMDQGTRAVQALLDDPARLRIMGEVGRQRLGPPGSARRIAERIASLSVA